MSRKFLSISIYLFFFSTIDKWKIICHPSVNTSKDTSSKDSQYVILDSESDKLLDDIDDAINDNDQQVVYATSGNQYDISSEEQLLDLTGGSLEDELRDASEDDAYVPKSLDNSITDDFERISLAYNENSPQLNYFSLEKVLPNQIPLGLIQQNYSPSDELKLIELYQSNQVEDTKQLFQYISQHIHHRLTNCLSNFGKWLTNGQLDEPIFYRNCVPCTNAVDLNFQSLFDYVKQQIKLKHYFVNTCDKQSQWISYISDMKYLSNDIENISSVDFTDVIQQNLLPNQRYIFQGIVRSNRAKIQQGFFHACNLINDHNGHLWIVDGQIQRVYDFNDTDDINELNRKYRPDYLARAQTGLFRPTVSKIH
ncbi:unnamed protein product [Adineta ricciae]|uniref:Uncharacterized protein n=1 Tax=Adineta ricciae TaxID=249248 RepID=A0A815US64_ADIRI|nr:unnamed protein product [Adineta ricciae]